MFGLRVKITEKFSSLTICPVWKPSIGPGGNNTHCSTSIIQITITAFNEIFKLTAELGQV